MELPDGTFETVYDVTDAAASDGHSLDYDWTEVVLFGESSDHDTVAEPLGRGVKVDRSLYSVVYFSAFRLVLTKCRCAHRCLDDQGRWKR